MPDFRITDHGTVWNIQAVSDLAKEFAREHFGVESWMGTPENFTTDWRPARDLADNLEAEGFDVRR